VRNTFVAVDVAGNQTTNTRNLATTGADSGRLAFLGLLLVAIGLAATFTGRVLRRAADQSG